jgi:hypothetical protein
MLQRRLAREYQGDSRVLALNQSMQLPGFWRRKSITQPRFSRLIVVRKHAPYSYREFKQLVRADL